MIAFDVNQSINEPKVPESWRAMERFVPRRRPCHRRLQLRRPALAHLEGRRSGARRPTAEPGGPLSGATSTKTPRGTSCRHKSNDDGDDDSHDGAIHFHYPALTASAPDAITPDKIENKNHNDGDRAETRSCRSAAFGGAFQSFSTLGRHGRYRCVALLPRPPRSWKGGATGSRRKRRDRRCGG